MGWRADELACFQTTTPLRSTTYCTNPIHPHTRPWQVLGELATERRTTLAQQAEVHPCPLSWPCHDVSLSTLRHCHTTEQYCANVCNPRAPHSKHHQRERDSSTVVNETFDASGYLDVNSTGDSNGPARTRPTGTRAARVSAVLVGRAHPYGTQSRCDGATRVLVHAACPPHGTVRTTS